MTERGKPDPDAGFLSRWSRRKALARDGEPLAPEPPPRAPGAHPSAPSPAVARGGLIAPVGGAAVPGAGGAAPRVDPAGSPAGDADSARASPSSEAPQAPAPRPALTLADVERLTPESNFAPFTARDVDPQVRNAAMKKLFHSQPSFNAMDGLDVYVDDYSVGEPLPKAIMRTMLQARALGLLDDELKDQDKPEPDEGNGVSSAPDTQRPDEDADLQLQPLDAAGPGGTDPGADAPAIGPAGTEGLEPGPAGQPER